MPDDLLRFVSGPPGYPIGWLWLGVAVLVVVFAWYAVVFVATMPSAKLRGLPGVRLLHARLLRRRFARTVAALTRDHRAGRLGGAAAGAAMSRTLRSFLHQATGQRAQYLQLTAIATGELAPAAAVLAALGDAQFDPASTLDVGLLGERTEELIRSWA